MRSNSHQLAAHLRSVSSVGARALAFGELEPLLLRVDDERLLLLERVQPGEAPRLFGSTGPLSAASMWTTSCRIRRRRSSHGFLTPSPINTLPSPPISKRSSRSRRADMSIA